MAQKIQTVFVDDLDGSEAEGTVRFGLDGSEYEIDLNADHAQALREALAPYVSAARRAGGGATRRPARAARRAPATGLNTTEVRAWGKAQGQCPCFRDIWPGQAQMLLYTACPLTWRPWGDHTGWCGVDHAKSA